jgi:hydrogenase maturation protease
MQAEVGPGSLRIKLNSDTHMETGANMDSQFEEEMVHFLDGRICLLGIGNRYWRDDGVGSVLAEALEACPEFDAIDAGFVPENHLEVIAGKKPDRILFIDATDFGGAAGQVRLLYPDKVAPTGLSTHAGSLKMLAEYLQARTRAHVALLAIQPADTAAGDSLSPEVSHTVKILLEKLPEFCRHSQL